MRFSLASLANTPTARTLRVPWVMGWSFIATFGSVAAIFVVDYLWVRGVSVRGTAAAVFVCVIFLGFGFMFLYEASQQAKFLDVDPIGFTFTNFDGSMWGGRWSDPDLKLLGSIYSPGGGGSQVLLRTGIHYRGYVTNEAFAALANLAVSNGLRYKDLPQESYPGARRFTLSK